MKAGGIVGLALLAACVAALAAGVWAFFKRPLEVWNFMNRQTLRRAGLKSLTVDTQVGRQVVFVGGDGPVLLLLHGAGDQAGTWAKVVPELAKRFTLVVPDLAGHGDSAPRTGPIDVPTMLGGVEAEIQRLGGGQKVTIVGNSLGAWLAMLIAHRHGDWVDRVIAVDGGALTGHGAVKLLPTNRQETREFMKLVRDPASPPIPGFVLDDVVRQAKIGPLARFAETAATMEQWTLDGRLGEIQTPVHLIWGKSDQLMPLDYAQRMLAALPHARLVTLDRCGHAPQVECPAQFLAALRQALSSVKR
jgi:pimeloyl-ACP methyl ester carboxylesterase